MDLNPEDPRWELIRAYADGSADEPTLRALEEALRADPTLRARFRDYLNVDGSLALHALGASARQSAQAEGRPSRMRLVAGITALLAIAVTSWLALRHDAPCAEMIEARSARWENSTLPTAPGSRLSVGILRLTDGLAQLRFASGANVTLEGPAELELLGPNLCRLHRGSLVAHVPAEARGFTVLTKAATLIDHGTDFGLSADGAGHAKVHVMQGEVELRHANGQPPVRLITQETASITPQELLPATRLEAEPTLRPSDPEGIPSAFMASTRDGRGAAATVTESATTSHRSSELLLLKHCAEPGYGRKIVLRFDLSQAGAATALRSGELRLQMAPSGFGFASRGGDARLVAYAVTADQADDWSAASLSWGQHPAFHADAGQVNATQAIRLGETTIPRGLQQGTVTIPLSGLEAVLARDRNRLLTLVIVRESRIEQPGGLVLGFAGNQHPTLSAPVLTLR